LRKTDYRQDFDEYVGHGKREKSLERLAKGAIAMSKAVMDFNSP
jgi:hypothetical protein